MYYRRNPQRNCRNNCNQRPCQNNCNQRPCQNNCNQRPCQNNCNQRPCQNNCNQRPCPNNTRNCNTRCDCPPPCCDEQRCNPRCDSQPCWNEPVCQPCYNEEDYKVDRIHQLFEEYNQIEKKADTHFNNALVKLCDAIEEIERGLNCNKEGREVWEEMECWLARYYERFGAYCGCIEKMQEFKDFVKRMLILEWASLEAAKTAYAQLEESRCLDKELHGLKCAIHDRCLPKC